MKIVSDRLLAVDALKSLVQEKGSLSSILSSLARDYPDANQALIREYCFGVCRWYHRLDGVATRIMTKPLRKKDADVRCLILLGLYQLIYMRTPDHAAINETVALTSALKKDWARGLVNAVLRQAQRDMTALETALDASPSTRFSHPAWLIDRLDADWPAHAHAILDSNNTQAPMTLRVNTRMVARAAYLEQLQLAGIDALPGKHAATAVVLASPVDVSSLPGFADGQVSVQDEASQLVAPFLDPAPGSRVLDACAAPGGKTCALLEHAADMDLQALDNNAGRLDRVRENLGRLSLQARVTCADAGNPESWWDGRPFDAMLLDAPCSGTGVIRRHPDIKLLRHADDIPRLVSLQSHMLTALWPCLKPGGKLLYSTCSVLRDENERQITNFLSVTPDAALMPLEHPAAVACTAGIQFFPDPGGMDGFYYALLARH